MEKRGMCMATMSRSASDEEKYYWDLWLKEKDPEAADYLIKRYEPLIDYHVNRMRANLPKNITIDELTSYAYIGLYDALVKFDSKRDLKFDTYASIRVRGAIIDGLRREDPLPRSLRAKTKKIESVIESLEQKYRRDVTVDEVAEAMNMDAQDVRDVLTNGMAGNTISIDEAFDHSPESDPIATFIEDKATPDPAENVIKTESVERLAEEIKTLTEKEQLVISLFYYEELTLSEIGRIMGLSTSRVSQIHSKALKKLRNGLKKEIADLD